MDLPILRVVDLIDPSRQAPLDHDLEQARGRLFAEDPGAVLEIRGSFALTARVGDKIRLARSLDRPMRYFLAKEPHGPMLVVAERIDEIAAFLEAEGYGHQFHPSYTRMVPAHHVVHLRLIGCPDPNPTYHRFFDPPRGVLAADPAAIGERYVAALHDEVRLWLGTVPEDEPLGVLFSGGSDSGLVLLSLYRSLIESGRSPSRLKAFVLAVDGGGDDLGQAREFLRRVDLEMLLEVVEVPAPAVDPLRAIETIEDYKPLDVECAAVQIALLEALRGRYPDWRHLADGDGGDENFKDYSVEENPELTIRSVVSNRMLYQEGWGVDCIKHSLTYSGGLSRGCARTAAPLRRFGFAGFSPHMRPAVVAVAEAAPWDELTRGSTERLYRLKGEMAAAGCRAVLDLELPVFPKRRFQQGAVSDKVFDRRLGGAPQAYREHFLELWGADGA